MTKENSKKILLNFLKSQKALILSSIDESGMPYITNLYMGVDDDLKIYFISSEDVKHSQHLLKNPNVAFSTVWFNTNNHMDRKGVQATGICRVANKEEEVEMGIKLHNMNYPEFAERITVPWIKDNSTNSKMWVVEPNYIKYWDDENFGEEAEEFNF